MKNVEINRQGEDRVMDQSYVSIMHEIKRAEADLFLWQILVDKITSKFVRRKTRM